MSTRSFPLLLCLLVGASRATASEVLAVAHRAGTPATTTTGGGSVLTNDPFSGPTPSCFSGDARVLTFTSTATDLVSGQSGVQFGSVFVTDLSDDSVQIVSHSASSFSSTANGPSGSPVISEDGRWIAYLSAATDLVSGQTGNGYTYNVILFDRTTGANLLVSHETGLPGAGGNADSSAPAISADGRWVSFLSGATDLVPGEVPGHPPGTDLFLFDRVTTSLTLVSHREGSPGRTADGATQWHAMSSDGRFVSFASSAGDLVPGQVDWQGTSDVFLFDREAGTVSLVTRRAGTSATAGNNPSLAPSISADGRFIAFFSVASDLVAGLTDTIPGWSNVYCFDRLAGVSVLVSHAPGLPLTTADSGSFDPRISADGRAVAYCSAAISLVPGQEDSPGLSGDVFVWDRLTGTNTLVSHKAMSATQTGSFESRNPEISADGSRVAFISRATDLVPSQVDGNDAYDVFLHDRRTSRTMLVGRTFADPATTGSLGSSGPRLSADGNLVAFNSEAPELVASDANGLPDAFLFKVASFGGATRLALLPPCRAIDTRTPGGPLPPNSSRDFTFFGVCGIPTDAISVSANVTVTGTGGSGFLGVFPSGLAVPATSVLSFSAGRTRANNAIVSLGGTPPGTVTVFNSSGGNVDVIVDVNGYFR